MRAIKLYFVLSLVLLSFWLLSCNTKEDNPDFTIQDIPLPAIKDSSNKLPTDSIIRITSLQLSSDYIANEVKADRSYKGKTLIVTGSIVEITKGIAGNIYIVLAGANRQRTILCEFNNEEKAAMLQKQQTVSLKGACDGLMGSIVMNDCEMEMK